MINYIVGNLFDYEFDAVVNPVNCEGVMGKGLALEFKQRFPQNYEQYKQACFERELRVGSMLVTLDEPNCIYPYIINFPTKKSWRNPSRMAWIIKGLVALRAAIIQYEIQSIGLPAVGCGLGGLRYAQIQPMIELYLGDLKGVHITVFKPVDGIKQGR